ncbi:Fc.00g081870.m01.CDS01 [Cosmosporella sp. VM-42]
MGSEFPPNLGSDRIPRRPKQPKLKLQLYSSTEKPGAAAAYAFQRREQEEIENLLPPILDEIHQLRQTLRESATSMGQMPDTTRKQKRASRTTFSFSPSTPKAFDDCLTTPKGNRPPNSLA